MENKSNILFSQGAPVLHSNDWAMFRESVTGTRSTFLSVLFLISAIIIAYVALLPNIYRSEALIIMESPQPDTPMRDIVPASAELVRSQLEVIQSNATVDRVIDDLGLVGDPEFSTGPLDNAIKGRLQVRESVARRLDVGSDGRSYAIKIGFESRDAAKAARIANAFAVRFIAGQREVKVRMIETLRSNLIGGLSHLREAAEEAEYRAEQYRSGHKLVILSSPSSDDAGPSGGTIASRQASELSRTQAELLGRSLDATAKWAQARRNPAKPFSGTALSSPLIQNLLGQQATLAEALAAAQTKRGPDNPEVKQLTSQLGATNNSLADELGRIQGSLLADARATHMSESAAADAIARLKREVGAEMGTQARYSVLAQEARQQRALYDELVGQVARATVRAASQLPDGVIASFAAASRRPMGSKPLVVGSLSAFAGLVIASAAAMARGLLRSDFVSAAQMERISGIPVINCEHPAETSPGTHLRVGRRLISFAHARTTTKTSLAISLLRAADLTIPPFLSWRWATALAQQGARVGVLAESDGPLPATGDRVDVIDFVAAQQEAETALDMKELAVRVFGDISALDVLLIEAEAGDRGIPELAATLKNVTVALVVDYTIRRDSLERQTRNLRRRGVRVALLIRLT